MAEVYTTNVRLESTNPLVFTVDVAVRNNNLLPVRTYYVRVYFNSDEMDIVQAIDIESLGTHFLSPIYGSGSTAFRNVSAFPGNRANTKKNMTLVRLRFQATVALPHTFQFHVDAAPPNPLLLSVPSPNSVEIPAYMNDSATNPLKMPFDRRPIDTDRDGYSDWYELSYGFNLTDPADRPLLGDVNNDGAVNLLDAILLRRHVSGQVILPDFDCVRADVNLDGICDLQDAIDLYRWRVGMSDTPVIPSGSQ